MSVEVIGYIIDKAPPGATEDGYNLLQLSGITVSSSEENSNFPLENLFNQRPSKPATFTSSPTITIDFAAAKEIGVVCIVGHNFSASATIEFHWADDAAFTVNADSETIDYQAEEIYHLLDSVVDKRYVKLIVTDDSNTAIRIGELVIGNPMQFTQGIDWNFSEIYSYNSQSHETDFGNVMTYHFNRIRSIGNMNFSNVTDDTASDVVDMIEESNGSYYPMVLFWDIDNDVNRSIYGLLTDECNDTFVFTDLHNITGLGFTALPFARELDDTA